MMTERLKGKTRAEAETLFRQFQDMVTGKSVEADAPETLGKLAVFAGVREFPARIKCASLAWHTFPRRARWKSRDGVDGVTCYHYPPVRSIVGKPEAERKYIFVRRKDGRIEHVVFEWQGDGSWGIGFLVGETCPLCLENESKGNFLECTHSPSWESPLNQLSLKGFIELSVAKATGLVPNDWQPSENSLAKRSFFDL